MKNIRILLAALALLALNGCGKKQEVVQETTAPELSWDNREDKTVGDYEVRISENRVAILKYLGEDSVVEIPTEIEGIPVVRIWNMAFRFNETLERVVIPEGVTRIGSRVFMFCPKLETVEIPSSVSSIGVATFSMSEKLTTIDLSPQNPFYVLEDGTLFNREKTLLHTRFPQKGVTSYTVPKGVEEIAEFAFGENADLKTVELPETLTVIGKDAFSMCKALETLELPESLLTIGVGAFYGCRSLTSITIPKQVKEIGPSAFSGCIRLGEVAVAEENANYVMEEGVLFSKDKTRLHTYFLMNLVSSYKVPDGVTVIESNAFSDVGMLKEIILPESLVEIGEWAFSRCELLEAISIPTGVARILPQTFLMCRSLKTVELPEGLTEIGSGAFEQTDSLRELVIPDSLEQVGERAFHHTSQELVLKVKEGSPMYQYAQDNDINIELK